MDKQLDFSASDLRLVVSLSDWCPACLEYKVVLNKLLSAFPTIPIEFIPPDKLNVNVIPVTFFLRGAEIKRADGYMPVNRLAQLIADFM